MNTKPNKTIKATVQGRPDLRRLYGHIRERLEDVEGTLKRLTRSSNPLIREISAYLFQKSGKRIRPALVLLCSGMTGGRPEDAVHSAALVELLHTASLLHDDIIDNSGTRRGKTAVHVKWGANVTVLLGDFLYIKTLAMALGDKHGRLAEILTDSSAKMIEGELQEYDQSGNLKLTERDYLRIIDRKTASLFSASCRIGGMLGGVSRAHEDALADYGSCLGMSFQVVDDLLDYMGDEKDLGKPVLADLAEGRVTLPLIHALRQNGRNGRSRIAALMPKVKTDPASRREVQDLIRAGSSLEYAYRRAEEYSLRARAALERFPPGTHRQSLSLLAEFVLTRDR